MNLRVCDQHRPVLLCVKSVGDRDSSAHLELGDYHRPALPVGDVIHVHMGVLSTHDDALWGPWAGRGAECCADATSCGGHAGTGGHFQLAGLQRNGATFKLHCNSVHDTYSLNGPCEGLLATNSVRGLCEGLLGMQAPAEVGGHPVDGAVACWEPAAAPPGICA